MNPPREPENARAVVAAQGFLDLRSLRDELRVRDLAGKGFPPRLRGWPTP